MIIVSAWLRTHNLSAWELKKTHKIIILVGWGLIAIFAKKKIAFLNGGKKRKRRKRSRFEYDENKNNYDLTEFNIEANFEKVLSKFSWKCHKFCKINLWFMPFPASWFLHFANIALDFRIQIYWFQIKLKSRRFKKREWICSCLHQKSKKFKLLAQIIRQLMNFQGPNIAHIKSCRKRQWLKVISGQSLFLILNCTLLLIRWRLETNLSIQSLFGEARKEVRNFCALDLNFLFLMEMGANLLSLIKSSGLQNCLTLNWSFIRQYSYL